MINLLNIAIKATLEASKAVMSIYTSEDFNIELKSDNSPLTRADTKAHKIIQEILEKTNIPILSEEGKNILFSTRKNWNLLWIVDPIDGTKEFIKRNGEFTINIALVENGTPILGVVYAPATKELYYSLIGKGSFKIKIQSTISINDILMNALQLPLNIKNKIYTIVASRSHLSEDTDLFIKQMKSKYGNIKLISKGSSLKLCLVAEGIADAYPRFAPTMEWDTAAGHAICKYAGFNVIDWKTKQEMNYNKENLLNNWFVVN